VHRRIVPLLSLLTFVFVLAACGGVEEEAEVLVDDSLPTPTSTTEAEPADTSTTVASTPPSTVYAPDTLEGQVEVAYLESLNGFMSAITEANPDHLGRRHTGDALSTLTTQVNELIENGESARFEITHDYEIDLISNEVARVQDVSQNHSVSIDRATGEPTESDPNEELLSTIALRLEQGEWKVSDIVHERRPLQ
jgi:hypothetical protein